MTTSEWAEAQAGAAHEPLKELVNLRNARQGTGNQIGKVRNAVSAVLQRLKIDTANVQIVDSYLDLPEAVREKEGADSADGAYDSATGTIYFIADKLALGRVDNVVQHETLGHRGFRSVFGEKYDGFLNGVLENFSDGVAAVAQRRGFDLSQPAQALEAADEFVAETVAAMQFDSDGRLVNDERGVFRKILDSIRAFLIRHGWNAALSDRDLARLAQDALKAERGNAAGKGAAGEGRFAIIGEKGVRNMPGEDLFSDRQMLLNDLATAKAMEAAGKDVRAIKLATGWEKGGDGLWRMEVPDLKLKFGWTGKRSLTLQKLADAPEIFAAYPDLKDMPVEFVLFRNADGSEDTATDGMYDDQAKAIYIRHDSQTVLGTLIHEVQHAIQDREGFAPGGSPEDFSGKLKELEQDIALFRKEADASQKYLRYEELDQQLAAFFNSNVPEKEYNDWADLHQGEMERLHDDPEVRALMAQQQKLVDKYEKDFFPTDVLSAIHHPGNEKIINEMQNYADRSAMRQYRALAGEVEARNATKRSTMSASQKRNSMLDDTADVAPEYRIYLERGGGASRMARFSVSNEGLEKIRNSEDPDINAMYLERNASNQQEALAALQSIAGKDIVNRETNLHGEINRAQRDKLVSGAALTKSKNNGFSFDKHFHAVANIDRLFSNGSLVDDRPDNTNDKNIVSIKRFVAPVVLNGEVAEAYITVKETTGNKIYSLELDELKKPSDLKGGTLKERYRIPEGYDKLLRKVEKARALVEKNQKNGNFWKNGTSDRSDGESGGVRFSEVRPDQRLVDLLTKELLPFADPSFVDEEKAFAYLNGRGINLDFEQDREALHLACIYARDQKRERIRAISRARENQELAKNDPFYRILHQQYGENFRINPGAAYEGQALRGTWMDDRKTAKGRSKAKNGTTSVTAEDAAKLLTEKTGKEVTPAMVVAHFKDRMRENVLAEYREKRREKRDLWNREEEIIEEERNAAERQNAINEGRFTEENGEITPFAIEDLNDPDKQASMRRNAAKRAREEAKRKKEWIQNNMGDLYNTVMEVLGNNPKIKPSARFIGEEFTGSFIAREFKTYSQDKSGHRTGKALADYMAKRQSALENAGGNIVHHFSKMALLSHALMTIE